MNKIKNNILIGGILSSILVTNIYADKVKNDIDFIINKRDFYTKKVGLEQSLKTTKGKHFEYNKNTLDIKNIISNTEIYKDISNFTIEDKDEYVFGKKVGKAEGAFNKDVKKKMVKYGKAIESFIPLPDNLKAKLKSDGKIDLYYSLIDGKF